MNLGKWLFREMLKFALESTLLNNDVTMSYGPYLSDVAMKAVNSSRVVIKRCFTRLAVCARLH